MSAFSYKKFFNPEEIKKGSFITVKIKEETSNGIVLNVTAEELTYTTYNSETEALEEKKITTEELNDENVTIVFSETLLLSNKEAEEEKIDPSAARTKEDFTKLVNNLDIERLTEFLQRQNPKIIASIAMLLNQHKKSQLLYLLPEDIMMKVQEEMKKANLNYLSDDMLDKIRKLFQQAQQTHNQRQNQRENEQAQNPFDIFGELFKNKDMGNPGSMMEVLNEMSQKIEGMLFDWLDRKDDDDDNKR